MAKFKIAWNDGHTLSGTGTGAVGIIKETDRNRRIGALARKYLLEYENVEIINCTIDKSENDMYEAVTRANNADANLFVSNHVNAGGGVGFESFYSRFSTQDNINKAKIIHKYLVATKSCLMNRRCTDDYSFLGYDLYVLRNTAMDAILCEIGFVDNQTDVNAINDDEVARAYAAGIAAAYGLKKKGTNSGGSGGTTTPTTTLYRVRKTWADEASQIGAYSILENAKNSCPKGYSVFDSKGNVVYSENLYRVRKTWADAASQLGAYNVLENAKNNCPSGYSVFDSKGNVVYSAELYRVRKTWADAASQIGAYNVLENAKNSCPKGYSVFDSKGNKVYSK